MSKIIFLFILLPLFGKAHPGIGIVKDSKGNIYYTDLKQVWKITNGKQIIIVPNVHTHELFIDNKDHLYGEDGYYDEKEEKFYHYLWVYKPMGQLDTVKGMSENYVYPDFSLAKDKKGNEYYLKRFLRPHKDTNHIYKKSPAGKETVFATGNFKNVNWLHPQDDGSLLFASHNSIYKADSQGNLNLIIEQVAHQNPSYKFSGNNITIWGLWQDPGKNIYAAVFSDQTVRRIDKDGNISNVYTSTGNWTPLHGVFDNDHNLWVLEGSDKNEVRVTLVDGAHILPGNANKSNSNKMNFLFICCIAAGIVIFYFKSGNFFKSSNRPSL